MATLFPIQLAETDTGAIVTIVAAVLYGAFRLIRWLAESKDQERRAANRERRRETGETEKEEEAPEKYVADETEVRRFLETLGVQPPARPEPETPQPPRPAPPGPPPRPPQRTLQVEPEPPVLAAAPSAPPPRPRRARQPAPMPEPAEAYTFGSPSAKPDHPEQAQTSAAHRHVAEVKQVSARKAATAEDRLTFPHLPPLQRAIILSDILGRRPGASGRARV